MSDSSQTITNFPKEYSWYKRWGANVTYWISNITLSFRKNDLSKQDVVLMKKLLEPGDIVLGGNFCQASQYFIEGIVTHAMAYLGREKGIHAHGQGVSFFRRRMVFRTYDTVVILRPRWSSDAQISLYREKLLSKLGKPYDFFFGIKEGREEVYFCTELINHCLQEVGYKTGLKSIKNPDDLLDDVLDSVFRAHRLLKPNDMIYGNFDVVFYSHNIVEEGGGYRLVEGSICE